MAPFNTMLLALHEISRKLQLAHAQATDAGHTEIADLILEAGGAVSSAVGKLVISAARGHLPTVAYFRHVHAGHGMYGGDALHDLEAWTVTHPTRPTAAELDAIGVPDDAAFSSSQWSGDGNREHVMTWSFMRTIPPTPGLCMHCRGFTSAHVGEVSR